MPKVPLDDFSTKSQRKQGEKAISMALEMSSEH